jgi:arsenate reductase (glutaredoxin)
VTITIYHNPQCGTSRNALAMIRNSGVEPQIIDYLQTPPSREVLRDMIAQSGLSVRQALREKGTPFAEFGLGNLSLADDVLLDAMLRSPILINRPFVVTRLGVRLCRPSEVVLEILPQAQRGEFKEDGEKVIGSLGQKIDQKLDVQ